MPHISVSDVRFLGCCYADTEEMAMGAEIEEKWGRVAQLCRQFGVWRVAVFGSALRTDLDPNVAISTL